MNEINLFLREMVILLTRALLRMYMSRDAHCENEGE